METLYRHIGDTEYGTVIEIRVITKDMVIISLYSLFIVYFTRDLLFFQGE